MERDPESCVSAKDREKEAELSRDDYFSQSKKRCLSVTLQTKLLY